MDRLPFREQHDPRGKDSPYLGYINNSGRTQATDKALLGAANQLGLSEDDVTMWAESSGGRHFMDSYEPTWKCSDRKCGSMYSAGSVSGDGKCDCDSTESRDYHLQSHNGNICGAPLRGPLIPAKTKDG